MSLSLHTLTASKRRSKKRVGRGNASGRGTYSSRGLKGQRSRSGGSRGIMRRSLKAFYVKTPKVKGFSGKEEGQLTLNLRDIDRFFPKHTTIRLKDYYDAGLLSSSIRRVKLLAQGELSRPVQLFVHAASQSAQKAVEKAGGRVTLIVEKPARAGSKGGEKKFNKSS